MQTARYVVLLAMVLVAAGATIAMALAYARMGGPVWQAALGPLLLAGCIALHFWGRRK
jgi:hypothetical protein